MFIDKYTSSTAGMNKLKKKVICGLPSSKKKIQIISKTARSSGKKINIKCVFQFSLKLLPETFPTVRRVEREMIMNANRSSLSCHILMKLECSRQILEKYSNNKFHKNPFSGSLVFPCGRTDKTKLIAAFRSFVNTPKKAIGINLINP